MHKIFRSFITDDIISMMMKRIRASDLVLRWRPKVKSIKLTRRKVIQVLAVIVRATGRQVKPNESQPNLRIQRNTLMKVSEELGKDIVGGDIIMRLVAHLLITEEIMVKVVENFTDYVFALGECVAGDEKLFKYTAQSPLVRQVPTKPDKVGLWFYQMCANLKNGMAFCLYIKLHNNVSGSVTVDLVVSDWQGIIMKVGADRVAPGNNPNPRTVLVFDNYYPTRAICKRLMEDKVPFTCSCRYDRFKGHVEKLRGPNHAKDNVKGESMAMHRRATGEVFVYVSDVQLNEVKYNLSYGFTEETNQREIKKRGGEIPIYSYYKLMFNTCDHFNRSLHDRSWPYHRGGKGVKGDLGRINDFCMAVTLENTFNAWYDINNISDKQISFRNLCDILSESLYLESLAIEDKVDEDDSDDNDSTNDNIANNGNTVVEESDDDDES